MKILIDIIKWVAAISLLTFSILMVITGGGILSPQFWILFLK